jgi:hypothetical protein
LDFETSLRAIEIQGLLEVLRPRTLRFEESACVGAPQKASDTLI